MAVGFNAPVHAGDELSYNVLVLAFVSAGVNSTRLDFAPLRVCSCNVIQTGETANGRVKAVHFIFQSLVFMQRLDAVSVHMNVVKFEITSVKHSVPREMQC